MSAGVIMPVYSGFSHISSIIGDIPLYVLKYHELFSNLGPKNIYNYI
jgi:hypothetical protein